MPLLLVFGAVFGSRIIDENVSLPTGLIAQHYVVYVPSFLRQTSWAVPIFSAATFAQCMHYLTVIYIMPKLLQRSSSESPKTMLLWPKHTTLWLIIVSTTVVLFVAYYNDFFYARSLYGIAAAVHAYVEIPILLWAVANAKTKQKLVHQPAMITY